MTFCPTCGARVRLEIPAGDNRERHVCGQCGAIHYVNPRVVVGVVCTWQDQFLLCRRAIEPRVGYWTFPAGFLEMNESAEEGAIREALEEACAAVAIERLLAVYSLPHVGQVQVFFTGRMQGPEFSCGNESLEVRLFTWEDLPWDDLAFPTIHWALKQYPVGAPTIPFATRVP
ncbi:MAG: zinc ribbon domain-containing protein [Cyanobacteria bacterium REEB65]|nr:zinc ribbon domain-containing protein [Cyanobacteria bacterium REEB65]